MALIHVNKYNGRLRSDLEGLRVEQPPSKQNCHLTTCVQIESVSFMTKHHGLSEQYIKLYTLLSMLMVIFEY